MTYFTGMKWIATRIAIAFMRLLSRLPFSVLYGIARFLQFFLGKVLSYRKMVIELNLIYTFPDKTSRELWAIRNRFYRHLSDLIVESIKSITVSEKEFRKHIQPHHDALQLYRKYEKTGKHIFVVLGHYGNWEWSALAAALESKLPFFALYQPSKNEAFNSFIVQTRGRFGCRLIGMNQVKTLYSELQKKSSFVAFVADQTPVNIDKAYWTKFLHMDTPFYKGFATMAVKMDAIVVYATVNKIETGYYQLELQTITENAATESEDAITEKFVRMLEKDIQNKPQYWLWSHRRWKRAGISY